ncbi:MAG: hypothetical protein E7592_03090 [Ruminococcaceae bacterium]|nr:hypothetical protein [Oscillospiraceae bacterium]
MKKTLNNIFDEANAGEIENLVKQNAAPEVTADTLSSIKGKVYAKTNLKKEKKNNRGMWLRFGAIAACFVLISSAILVVPMLREDDPGVIPGPGTTDNPVVNPPNHNVPSISTIISGNKITGKQELVYGDPSSGNEGDAEMIAPGFEIRTVIEAEVIEVLPDTYYYAASYYQPFHVAKLRVVDQIRGEGLPNEIFLCYPFYDTTIFDGYERFILSLDQVGAENYMLINDTQSRIDYFSNMFEVCLTRDIGYGSVIAFNNAEVDESFWEKTDYLVSMVSIGRDVFDNMLDSPSSSYYPASRTSTIEEVKSNIVELANKTDNWHISNRAYDFVTLDDVFISDAAKEIRSYLEPSETNVFMYSLVINKDRVIADFTRIINGFKTDETICINGYNGENGNVFRQGESYTAEDLAKVPNIGEALEKMDLSELKPSHIEVVDGMYFKYANAMGVYRKVDGKIYGIVRVIWHYTFPEYTNGYVSDDCYYLYDENGNGSIVERDELKEVIGDDSIIARFSYDDMVAWD